MWNEIIIRKIFESINVVGSKAIHSVTTRSKTIQIRNVTHFPLDDT